MNKIGKCKTHKLEECALCLASGNLAAQELHQQLRECRKCRIGEKHLCEKHLKLFLEEFTKALALLENR